MSATTGPTSTASGPAGERHQLNAGTLLAAALAVAVAQVGLSIPAVLNGLFQMDLHTSSTQLTWISDAFLVPITLFELSFGVVGDLFGRKRLLAGGAALMVVGSLIASFTPSGTSTGGQVAVLWTGQVIAGLGAAAIFPTSIAMLASGTHTARERAHAISVWAAALTGAGFISPVLAGLLARLRPLRRSGVAAGAGPSSPWPCWPWSAPWSPCCWPRTPPPPSAARWTGRARSPWRSGCSPCCSP